jgi:hypothetical protein
VLRLLVVVTLAIKTDTDAVWDVLNTTAPDSLVQLGVNTDILGTHSLFDKSTDGLDGSWGALLEGPKARLNT